MAGKRITLGFLLLLGIMACCPKVAAAERQLSGTCGPSAAWSVNPETKVLTIRGTGAITERIPWASDYEDAQNENLYVDQIVIEEGITSIDACRPFLYLQCTPSKISLPDTLRRISDTAFCNLSNIKTITIPRGVNQIGEGVFMKDISLEDIVVAPGNQYYCSVDGVLYTKNQRSLLAFPANKKIQGGVFVVPEGVRKIAPLAFAKQRRIKEVVLPGSLKELGGGAFFECSRLKKINLADTEISELPDFDGKEMGLPNELSLWDGEYSEDSDRPEEEYYIMGTFASTAIETLILPDAVQEISSWCISNAAIQKLYLGTDYIGSINAFHPKMESYTYHVNKFDPKMESYCHSGNLYLQDLEALKEIEVAEDNSCYMVKDSLLYSKDGTIVYGFPHGKRMSDIILDQSVRQIAPYAFYEGNIQSVTCQGSLTSIGEYAFYYSHLDKFQVNGNVSYIEEYAFYNSELMEFSVTGHVFSIGDYAFHSCEYLKDAGLQIGRQLYETTRCAFFHLISMDRIRKILVPNFSKKVQLQKEDSMDAVVKKWQAIQESNQNNDTRCGENACWKLDGKTLIVYGTGSISEKINLSEQDAEGVQKLVIEEGITGITGQKLFADLGGIRHVELPDSLETISAFAFVGFTQMTKIRIPQNVSQIVEGSFYGMSALEKIQVDADNKFYTSQDGVLFSKDMHCLVGFPCGKSAEVYLVPDTVTEISPLAFAGTYGMGLSKVVLPENLQKLGGGAFYASSIDEINLQDTQVTELPDYNGWKWKVRDYCYQEKDQEPEEKAYYYWGMFEYSSLYYLNLPDGVKEISSYCFRNSRVHILTLGAAYCGKINHPRLPWADYEKERDVLNSFWDIKGEDILINSYRDSLLLSDCLHEGLEVRIPRQNPYYCARDGVIYNKDETIVYGLSSRTKRDIVLKDTVREIAPTAFWGERYLQTVSVPGDLQCIGAGAFVGSGLREIKINGVVQTVGDQAFYGSKLTLFDSRGTTRVEDYAFAHTYLSTVNLGQEVCFMGRGVFQDCYALQKVSYDGTAIRLASDLFANCPLLQDVSYSIMHRK